MPLDSSNNPVQKLLLQARTLPLTIHLSAWYTSHGLAGLGMVFAIAFFGSCTSKGTRLRLRV